jgi:uncharacterized protein (TIGR03437 family)
VVNAASLALGAVAPGEIVTIFGSWLGQAGGSGGTIDSNGRLSTRISGLSVTFDGVAAPLLYADAYQINAIVPFEVAGRATTQVAAVRNGLNSASVTMIVSDRAPGMFTVDQTGAGQAVLINEDGFVNSQSHPAKRGSVVTMWLTGMGLLTQSYADGDVPVTTLGSVVNSFTINTVTPGQFPMSILYAGQAPYMAAGVVQINARIASDIQPFLTNVSLLLRVNGSGPEPFESDFANVVTIWLDNVSN